MAKKQYYDERRLAIINKKYRGIVRFNSKNGKAEHLFGYKGRTISITGTVRIVMGVCYFTPNKWAKNYRKWFEFERTRQSYGGVKDSESHEATCQELTLNWNISYKSAA